MTFSERLEIRGVEVEAAAWIAQVNAGQWSAADQVALREWCTRSPAHRETLRRMCSAWTELDELSMLREASERAALKPMRLKWNRFWAVHTVIAGLLLVLGAAWLEAQWLPRMRAPAVELYATKVGEQRTVVLADGSTVRLNTSSLLEVSYRPDERRVRLVEGEALFEVVKDTGRPFMVNVAGTSVRAVGTRFSVRLRHDDVEVVVSEGSVMLTRSAGAAGSPELMQPGLPLVKPAQIATVRDRTNEPIRITTVDVHELQRRLSWTEGVLEFDGEPLEKVIAEVSRYTPLKITIVDPELQRLPVGGRFKIGETRALFEVIEAAFGARVVESKGGILITKAPAQHS